MHSDGPLCWGGVECHCSETHVDGCATINAFCRHTNTDILSNPPKVLVSPVLAGLAVAIGVPILLFYVYGVVPVSLCRAGCGVSTTRDGFKFDFDEEGGNAARHQADAASVDAVSRLGATSIGEVSLSVASGSHLPAGATVVMQQPTAGGAGLVAGGCNVGGGGTLAGSNGAGADTATGGCGGGSAATAGTTSVSNVSTSALAGSITG